ncbi:MAG: hypothetical protein HFI88_11750 [Lachnospiraceae bacterium]|nr:hypothetical protein [Lachnospiraceae bacterium]
MQEKNALAMEYLDDRERIADFVNVVYFHGKQVVKASDVQEADSVQYRVRKENREVRAGQAARDKVRKVVLGMQCVWIGIEHLSSVHSAMPLRVMGYDVGSYERQAKRLRREHRRKSDLSGKEYISGLAVTDRLWPTLTSVLYMGEEPWTGPRDLHGMLEWGGELAHLREYVPNYKLHIIEAGTYLEWEKFSTDLRLLFGYLHHRGSEEQMRRYLEEYGKEYENLQEDLYDLLGSISHADYLLEAKEKNRTEQGGINMCKALQEWVEHERREGMEQGIEQGEERINTLYMNLLRDSRGEDLQRAIEDKAYRGQLCREYGLKAAAGIVGVHSNSLNRWN